MAPCQRRLWDCEPRGEHYPTTLISSFLTAPMDASMPSDKPSDRSSSPRPELLLASSSRYRKQLLERLGLPFVASSPDVDETERPGETPKQLVMRLAEDKARALTASHKNHLIIGSDQVACVNEHILGKPGTQQRAREQLGQLSGNSVHFYTALALLNSATGRLQVSMDLTEVEFRVLSAPEIEAYVATEQPLDCAGSFKSEGLGVALFERISTQDPAALIGLPLVRLCEMLRNEHMNPLTER